MMSNGYLASSDMQISTENYEIVPPKPEKWTVGYRIKKLSLDNIEECTVIINDITTVKLKAGQGFEMSYNDPPIRSFVIKEEGISFNFIAAY